MVGGYLAGEMMDEVFDSGEDLAGGFDDFGGFGE
jgi:hypothetical protein